MENKHATQTKETKRESERKREIEREREIKRKKRQTTIINNYITTYSLTKTSTKNLKGVFE